MGLDVGKSLILVATTFSIFAILVAKMPYFLVEHDADRPVVKTPDNDWWFGYFVGEDVITDNATITRGSAVTLEIVDTRVHASWGTFYQESFIILQHMYPTEVFFLKIHWPHEIKPEGGEQEVIDLEYILKHADEQGVSYFTGTCDCPKTFQIFINYNETAYDGFEEAWNAGVLNLTVGLPSEDAVEEPDMLGLITSMLFYPNPNINPMIDIFIKIPVWICVAFIAFWALKTILHG